MTSNAPQHHPAENVRGSETISFFFGKEERLSVHFATMSRAGSPTATAGSAINIAMLKASRIRRNPSLLLGGGKNQQPRSIAGHPKGGASSRVSFSTKNAEPGDNRVEVLALTWM